MELIKQDQNVYILRLAYGEGLRETLESFCAEKKIKAAWLNAIGASKEFEIGCYNLEKKQYDTQIFSGQYEIVGVIGDVSMKDGMPYLHAHGTFSSPSSMQVVGGHIIKCVISATCEISLRKLDGEMGRKHDEFTGLHLLCAESI